MSVEFDLYAGKSYQDLLKDIVVNTENKRDQIDIIIAELRDQIKTINDAIVLAPIIQGYLDTAVKNDDALIKLAGIVQKLIAATKAGDDPEQAGFLSDDEKKQLLADIKEVHLDVKHPIEVKKIEKK
jgi:membrane-bound lytic murein transglycosylase MltF